MAIPRRHRILTKAKSVSRTAWSAEKSVTRLSLTPDAGSPGDVHGADYCITLLLSLSILMECYFIHKGVDSFVHSL